MARIISLTDDTDGTPGAVERSFSVADVNYLIDLTQDNYAQMLAAFEPWRSVARVERKGTFKLTTEDRVRIREWATVNGLEIKARGRFPHSVIQAYFNAIAGDD